MLLNSSDMTTSTMNTMASTLEQLIANKRVRTIAGLVWVAVAISSTGLVWASKAPVKTVTQSMVASLPERPLDIPILRQLPQPVPMKAKAQVARATGRRGY